MSQRISLKKLQKILGITVTPKAKEMFDDHARIRCDRTCKNSIARELFLLDTRGLPRNIETAKYNDACTLACENFTDQLPEIALAETGIKLLKRINLYYTFKDQSLVELPTNVYNDAAKKIHNILQSTQKTTDTFEAWKLKELKKYLVDPTKTESSLKVMQTVILNHLDVLSDIQNSDPMCLTNELECNPQKLFNKELYHSLNHIQNFKFNFGDI